MLLTYKMSDVKAIVVESDDECSKLKPLVVKKKKPTPVSDDEDVSEDITESEEEEEEDDITESESSEEDGASFTTTEILQNDPLYFVLSRIFMTQDEEQTNVATLLQQIVKKLDILIQKKS